MVEYKRFGRSKMEKEGRQGGRINIRTAILSYKGWRAAIFCFPSERVRMRIREAVLRMMT